MGQNVNYNKLNSNSIKRSSPTINVTWEGSLYDVTDFAARHPGGQEILEKYNGQDVETVMRDPAIHQHSKAAYSILKKYLVEAVSHHASRDKDLNQVSWFFSSLTQFSVCIHIDQIFVCNRN